MLKTKALEEHFDSYIEEDTVLTENGEPILYYGRIKSDEEIKKSLTEIKYSKHFRTGTLATHSRTFGFAPRVAIRRDYCSEAALSRDFPAANKQVLSYTQQCEAIYQQHFPEKYAYHHSLIEGKIMPQWRINGRSIFTSGIINKNNVLRYHYDAGNFKNVMSNMITFRKDTGGGALVFPEYRFAIPCEDSTIAIFDGQKILHGVTSLKSFSSEAYRYTIVYYSLDRMCNCLTIEQELERIQNLKSKREMKRLEQRSV